MNSWKRLKNFIPTANRKAFTTNEGAFIADGYTTSYNQATDDFTYSLRVRKYDPTNDSWKTEIIGATNISNGSGFSFDKWIPVKAIENSSKVYIQTDFSMAMNLKNMYILDTSTKTLTRIKQFPQDSEAFLALSLNDKLYLKRIDTGTYSTTGFYYYEASNNSWNFEMFPLIQVLNGGFYSFAFDINNIGYVGSSSRSSNNKKFFEFDVNR